MVMRILAAGEPISLDKLGLTVHDKERLEKTVSKLYRLFYVCGPTVSGKTTALHSVLKFLGTADTKFWTAEDAVEITQKGLRQVQINKKAGIDFALVMRAFLRAELFASAVNSGMRTFKMDGMEKVLMGLTDLKMVRSVCIK